MPLFAFRIAAEKESKKEEKIDQNRIDNMKKAFLDTNFLVDLIKFKIGISEIDKIILEPHRLVLLPSVLNELEKMARKKGRSGMYANIVLKMIKEKKLGKKTQFVKSEGKSFDKEIIDLAGEDVEDVIVATNDKILRKELKEKNIKTIYIRRKKYITMN